MKRPHRPPRNSEEPLAKKIKIEQPDEEKESPIPKAKKTSGGKEAKASKKQADAVAPEAGTEDTDGEDEEEEEEVRR